MSDGPKDNEITPAEEALGQEMHVRKVVLERLYQMWVEHYYPAGKVPADPGPYNDALTVSYASTRNLRDIPEETVDLAESLLYAVEKLQETLDMIYAEAAITGGVEELNEIMQWKKEITGEEPEGLAGPEEK